jgi:hypothetical protein
MRSSRFYSGYMHNRLLYRTCGVNLANAISRLKVINHRFARDEFLAWACIRLDRLAPGIRLIHLSDLNGNPNGGSLLVKIDIELNRKK